MSAKSRLIRPGITIRSVTPRTPMCSTLSASLNASAKVVRSLAIRNRFWFGITIRVSTYCCSSARPPSATRMRCAPSKWNGLVTTPTVRMPCSRTARAITGAAPVPVPPPMPAVMNTMWLPCSWSSSSSIASSAAARPISGRAPAPRPWVIVEPSWTRRSVSAWCRDCASVLQATNSTPSRCEVIILLTALLPAPPTPITVIRGRSSWVTGILRLMVIVTHPPPLRPELRAPSS
jgi:hypothetical protein